MPAKKKNEGLSTEDALIWARAELDKSLEPRRTHLANIVASLERLLVAEIREVRKEIQTKGVK